MNRIKQLRKKKKLSIDALSKEIRQRGFDISASSISKYERGKRNPKINVWQALADYFNVSVPYLRGADNPRIIIDAGFTEKQKSQIRQIFDEELRKLLKKKMLKKWQ